jgi:hypothetical protein
MRRASEQAEQISSKELFEEKFKDLGQEWQHLSTLKLVFDRCTSQALSGVT